MSFIRAGMKTNVQKKKKVVPKKPKPWDDTVTDLTAYKATPEEIAYRKNSHKSKHAVALRLGKPMAATQKGKKSSPFRSHSQARKLAIMKEVLYDQQQLQDVLEKSDTMMAVVKDLFGDDPRRFAGFPAVTTAPNADDRQVSHSLVTQHPEITTRREFLSDSMMDSSALNDLRDSDSDDSPAHISYHPKMNMQRFQQFVEAEERNNTLSTISGQAGMSHLAFNGTAGPVQSSQLPDQTGHLSQADGSMRTPQKGHDESIEILRPPGSAINDTKKVKKTKSRVAPPQPARDQNQSSFSLPDLRKVLENLEEEIADYERQTGRRPPAERQRQETFSGYTQAIVDSVTKLTRYLKECEMRLSAETTVREQLSQDVQQFRALVDALTSDIIVTQEQFAKMASEFQRFRKETHAEIARLRGEQVPEETSVPPSVSAGSPETGLTVTPPRYQQPLTDADLEVPRPVPQIQDHFGDHLQPVSSAVMLSPPVRRNRVVEAEKDTDRAPGTVDPAKQTSLLDLQGLVSNSDSCLSEYASLPGTSDLPFQQCPVSYSGPAPYRGHTHSLSSSTHSNQSVQSTQSQPEPRIQHTLTRVQPTVQSHPSKPFGGQPVLPQQPYPGAQASRIPAQPQPTGISTLPQAQKQAIPAQVPASRQMHNKPSYTAPLNTVSVPRPSPLVQSNVGVSIQQSTLVSQQHHLVPVTQRPVPQGATEGPESMGQNSDRELLASQIAELNRQHEEAQRRLQGLLIQKQRIGHQVPDQQLPVSTDQPGEIVTVYPAERDTGTQVKNQSEVVRHLPKPVIPPAGNQSQFKQPGLPKYPVSPNISPISQRSDNFRAVYQSLDSQDSSMVAPASRGITVSIPKMDLDVSEDSPSPKHLQTVR